MSDEARILVEPRALVDEEVSVRVEGVAPGTEVELLASTVDEAGLAWTSRALFVSDKEGGIDLRTQAPVEGSWSSADPMAFIWSMHLPRDTPSQRYQQSELEPSTVALRARVAGTDVACAETERVFVDRSVERLDVRDHGLVATLFCPRETTERIAVLVVGGSAGGLDNARAAALANHGYPALSLAYFGIDPLPKELVGIEIEYFETAMRWLSDHGLAHDGRCALMGTSRGGELVLLLASFHPKVRGVVAYVPSGLVHGGIQSGGDPTDRPPAWIRAGRPFISAPMAFERIDFGVRPVRFAPGFAGGLEDKAGVEAAKIPVGNIDAPVLLFSGRDDQLWPSRELARIAESGLVNSSRVEHVAYPDAGHNIGHPYLPASTHSLVHPLNGLEIALGGSDAGDARARRDSWRRVLALLEGL